MKRHVLVQGFKITSVLQVNKLLGTMMFQSQVPLHIGLKGSLQQIILIPSSALQHKMPFEVLYNRKSDYSYLRVFVNACCPCLRPYSAHKFEPRSLQCIFSWLQRGL